ncbi:MAG: hypothetical protein K8R36_11155 [Planctomycetales bacterium]|nr:hypothetical protein [Planctomycetales bacterium]
MQKNTGNLEFTKEEANLRFSYFDTGITDAEIRVSASKNVVLEPVASKGKPEADEPKKGKDDPKAAKTPVKKPAKKPGIPGLPELPPGVEIPDEVKDLLKKALEEKGDK